MLQGKPTLTYSRDGLPEYDYAVTVTRATAPDRYEIYTATLQKRLPKFKLPLAADDRDALLDLQAAFTRAYDLGNFGSRSTTPPRRRGTWGFPTPAATGSATGCGSRTSRDAPLEESDGTRMTRIPARMKRGSERGD